LNPHLTCEDNVARLNHLNDFLRIRRWLVMRHAMVDPAPAKDIACRLGLSVFTVRDLIEAYNRYGPDALETTGKGQRQRAYRSVEEEHTFLAPFLADGQAGPIAIARTITPALEASLGHPVATSTVYRLLHRHQWRKVVPRPKNPRSSPEAQDTLKKISQPSSKKCWKRVRLTRRALS